MEQTWDIEFAKKVADAGAKFIRGYVAELRDQGKTKGKLFDCSKWKDSVVLDYRQ
jgi:hypothetical protein